MYMMYSGFGDSPIMSLHNDSFMYSVIGDVCNCVDSKGALKIRMASDWHP